MPTQKQKDINFLQLAILNGCNLSKDPSRKVGCIIVSQDEKHYSFGYNGFPKNIEETKEKWSRPKKYSYVLHAEINSVINANFDTEKSTAYTSFKPCHLCLGVLINAGVKRVIWMNDPVPYINQDENVFNDLIQHVEWQEYPLDEKTKNIINMFAVKHDEYKI